MEENKLNFHLEALIRDKDSTEDFEGPLSLILELLRKNKIEIRDIRIAEILDQYLEYLDRMQSMDLEIASEFVQMASTLLLIKSKMLLSGDQEEISELDALIASLEKLQAKDYFETLRSVIPELEERSKTGLLYYTRSPEPLPKNSGDVDYGIKDVDMLAAMLYLCTREKKGTPEEWSIRPSYPRRVLFSVREKSRQIIDQLRKGPQSLRDLFSSCGSRTETVAAFLSVLELSSMGSVQISFEENSFTLRLVSDDIDRIMEQITEE